MSNLSLKNNPTLKDYQVYIEEMVKERGFGKETIPELFLRLSEEVGEMAKASRRCIGMSTDSNSRKPELAQEVADVFIYILAICNYFDVDLEKAFRDKEEINKKRTWQ